MPVHALIIDYKALTRGNSDANRALLEWVEARGLRWCLFTTHSEAPDRFADSLGYPRPAAHVQLADIPDGKNRGAPEWVEVAAERLGVQHNELLYLGASSLDWRTAGNAGALYIHAAWGGRLQGNEKALHAQTADTVRWYLEHFLLQDPCWAYSTSQDGWEMRCLLPASASLPRTSNSGEFTLQNIFTYENKVEIGSYNARDILMLSVLANAYLEGLMTPNSLVCVYPSSTPGQVNEPLGGFLEPASHLFRGYYRTDLLVRSKQALDTSRERVQARKAGREARVSIATQATTVHLDAAYEQRKKLAGKPVIVADDFTTHGMSLDWARTLLTEAGAERVLLLAVGKYGQAPSHTTYTPRSGITPFAPNQLGPKDFTEQQVELEHDAGAVAQMRRRLEGIIRDPQTR